MMNTWQCGVLLCVLLGVYSAQGLVHHLTLKDDTRGSFFIESFGFDVHGQLLLNISDIHTDFGSVLPQSHRLGIVIKHTGTNYQRFLQDHPDEECLLDLTLDEFDYKIDIVDWVETARQITIPPGGSGFYDVYFINCDKVREPMSLELKLVMYNPGPNFLSAGDEPLPVIYGLYSLCYFVMISYWVWAFIIPREGNKVFHIHYLMTLAVSLKFGAVFFHAVELYYLNQNGHPGGWTWIYLIFSLLKGVSFFIVVALIGTGWAFIKPYLTERDRNVFLIVIPLQIVSNIALIIIEETTPGSRSWFAWVFRLVDIICCIAILVPIVGSIKHLQEASQADGKAAKNVEKLKLFREFYLLVVSYIYFTRIIVFLLDSTLPYSFTWISTFVSELCTIFFFGITGYYFRPVPENPYLKLDPEEVEQDVI